MITQEMVRAYFQDKHAWMTDILRGSFPKITAQGGPNAHDEAVHNTIALAFENVTRCAADGKIADDCDLVGFTKSSLWWAVGHTRAGRSITRKSNVDKKYGDVYQRMAAHTTAGVDAFIGRTTPVPDAVSFRVDTPAFLATLTERQRGMASALMAGLTTNDVAARYGVTPAAVSQFRARFHTLYREFFGDV